MRISTNTIYELGVASMQRQTTDLLQTQQQISANRRILVPSDDPVAAAKVLEVSQSQSLNKQFDTNTGSATSKLGLQDTTLNSVGLLIQNIQTTAVNAGSGALSNTDRATLAQELRSNYQELMGLVNTTDDSGQYMFSGYKGGTRPFNETAPGTVVYLGDEGQRLIQISPSRQIPVSDSGASVFQQIKNGNGTFVSRAATTNTGAGIIDPGTVTDPAKWIASNKDYSLRFAANTNVTAGSTNTGTATVKAGIVDQSAWNASGKGLQISVAAGAAPGTFDYTITDTVLGSYVVNYNPATQNPLTVKLNGSGGTFNAGIDLVLSGTTPAALDTFTVSPSATPGWTYDIIDNTTNTSLLSSPSSASSWSANWRTYTSGQAILLTSQGSEPVFDFGVATKMDGSPAGGDTFTIKASQNESLFTTLHNLITSLETGAGSAVSSARLTNDLNLAMTGFNNAQTNISKVRASVGAHMNEVDSVKSTGADLQLQYQQTISNLQDLDYAKAITDLTRQKTSLEAAQQSFVKVSGLSLFSYM